MRLASVMRHLDSVRAGLILDKLLGCLQVAAAAAAIQSGTQVTASGDGADAEASSGDGIEHSVRFGLVVIGGRSEQIQRSCSEDLTGGDGLCSSAVAGVGSEEGRGGEADIIFAAFWH